MISKNDMRKILKERRAQIGTQQRNERSNAACKELFKLAQECLRLKSEKLYMNGSSAHTQSFTIASFAAFGSEANPALFTTAAYQQGWNVCFPAVLNNKEMAFYAVHAHDFNEAHTLAPHVAEPLRIFTEEELPRLGFPLVQPQKIDFLVLPLVGFDAQNYRLGYGGGNYDRYLPLLCTDTFLVGFAFAEQEVEAVPREEHDLPCSRIIIA